MKIITALLVPDVAAPRVAEDRQGEAPLEDRIKVVVRRSMPLGLIFDPSQKISIPQFLESQKYFFTIAELLLPLVGKDSITASDVEKLLKGSDVHTKIQKLFKKGQDEHLKAMCECCADALNNLDDNSGAIEDAISGKIINVKNALIAMRSPKSMQTFQNGQKVTVQEIETIKTAGHDFFVTCVRQHVNFLAERKEERFIDELRRAANGMKPFVEASARTYLKDLQCYNPRDPLPSVGNFFRFRNPTGYNRHGFLAATFMEVALSAMGFKARYVIRTDLDPRASLTSNHTLVVVTGPDDKEYIVDPTFSQFLDGVYPKISENFPTILVLPVEKVEEFLETNLMSKWKIARLRVLQGNKPIIKALRKRDCLLQYEVDKTTFVKCRVPTDQVENWARAAYGRVWDVKSYQPGLANKAEQETFFPSKHDTHLRTFQLLQSMKLPEVTPRISDHDVKQRLGQMLADLDKTQPNKEEALRLISKIPRIERYKYMSLIDADPRDSGVDGLNPTINAFYHHLKGVVNPENRDFVAVYGCCGGDVASLLYSTNATQSVLVDLTTCAPKELQLLLIDLNKEGKVESVKINNPFLFAEFSQTRPAYGGSSSMIDEAGAESMPDPELKIVYNLKLMGVDLSKVEVVFDEADTSSFQIKFPWKHHHDVEERKRVLTYYKADITNPALYPQALREHLEKGIDAFFMKAATFAPKKFPIFLPQIASFVSENGFLMTTDKAIDMSSCMPDDCLEEAGLQFTRVEGDDYKLHVESLTPPVDIIVNVPTLGKKDRTRRMPGADQTYWSMVTLRKKGPDVIEDDVAAAPSAAAIPQPE